ncbi:hypothetical protein GCM10017786_50130 [Amycolatopsis deserti]|uniref:Uncharacterized protein n=1 Tax=Amycolatopsis deserti TaxID=185696 RepID=A0ABQ3JCI0_9PSEU|nr:hypothetical protein GCM10017786_50130 [Amycolatopsis deserti]
MVAKTEDGASPLWKVIEQVGLFDVGLNALGSSAALVQQRSDLREVLAHRSSISFRAADGVRPRLVKREILLLLGELPEDGMQASGGIVYRYCH